jgi:hypothetical protein
VRKFVETTRHGFVGPGRRTWRRGGRGRPEQQTRAVVASFHMRGGRRSSWSGSHGLLTPPSRPQAPIEFPSVSPSIGKEDHDMLVALTFFIATWD